MLVSASGGHLGAINNIFLPLWCIASRQSTQVSEPRRTAPSAPSSGRVRAARGAKQVHIPAETQNRLPDPKSLPSGQLSPSRMTGLAAWHL